MVCVVALSARQLTSPLVIPRNNQSRNNIHKIITIIKKKNQNQTNYSKDLRKIVQKLNHKPKNKGGGGSATISGFGH